MWNYFSMYYLAFPYHWHNCCIQIGQKVMGTKRLLTIDCRILGHLVSNFLWSV